MGNTFLERGYHTGVFKATKNKLFASNEKQIDNCTLMLDMAHSYMSVVSTIVEVSLKIFFWYGNLHVRVFSTYKTGIVTTLNDFATCHTGTGRCCKNVCLAFSYVHVSFPKNLV